VRDESEIICKKQNQKRCNGRNKKCGTDGASGRCDHLKEIALDYAFLLR
jgi:protease II